MRTDHQPHRRTLLHRLAGLLGLLTLGPLAGCGFRLRGTVALPTDLSPLYVQAPAGSPVAAALREQIIGSELPLATNGTQAKLTLRIQSEQRRSRVVATDNSGKVLASELVYRVGYDAVKPDGAQFLPPQTLELQRNFDDADVEVLGKQLEEAQIYREFAVDAADRILLRLRSALR